MPRWQPEAQAEPRAAARAVRRRQAIRVEPSALPRTLGDKRWTSGLLQEVWSQARGQAPEAAVAPEFHLSARHFTLYESRKGRYWPLAQWPLTD